MSKDNTISFRKFAEKYGISDTSVRFYVKKGHIGKDSVVINTKNKRPSLIEESAVKDLRNNYKSDWGMSTLPIGETKATTEKPKKESSVKTSADIPVAGDSIVAVNLSIAKVKLATETLSLKQKEGELVSYADVQKALFEKGNQVKTTMQSIPAKYIDSIMAASLKGRNDAVNVLTEAINAALWQLGEISDFTIKR